MQITQLQALGPGWPHNPQAGTVTAIWQVTKRPIPGSFLGFLANHFHLEKNVHQEQAVADRLRTETMTFARQLGTAVVLVTLTLWIQCLGMAELIHWARASIDRGMSRLNALHAAILMIRFSILVIILHFFQILLWSGFYRWYCLPSWESSFYFSATSYSTVGYGDVILPRLWRLMGPVESVTGVLMCGISVSFLFVVATKIVEREAGALPGDL